MKYLTYCFIVLTFTWCLSVNACSSPDEQDKHKGHMRIGYHGMVMVTDGTQLYASHLPLYVRPHDYQIVYLVESAYKQQLINRLTENEQSATPRYQQNMVTLLPAKFDLNRLIDGQSFEIETQFFMGHFERGGEKWFKDEKLHFVHQIYKRPLAVLDAKTHPDTVHWHALNTLPGKEQLFIYPIQTAPSFDAIVLARNCTAITSPPMTTSNQVPDFEVLKKTISSCKSSEILYFETRDFAQ